jgi:hypothetical protein
VNKGLVTALNSVGQNLFGSAVFNVTTGDPIIPPTPIRMFFADNSQIGSLVICVAGYQLVCS